VRLAPLAVSREWREWVAVGEKNVQRASDVWAGEVWLCSGQSNVSMARWTNAPKMELHKQPRALWNAMIHPLAPFYIRSLSGFWVDDGGGAWDNSAPRKPLES